MSTTLVNEGRKLHSAESGHVRNGKHTAPQNDRDELLNEIMRLVDASKEGRLSERGRATIFNGPDREVIQGVNEMLDAILLPIGEGNRILAQISDGKIDELIAQTYKGDHEKMKLAINNVAIVLQGLQKEMGRLTRASHEGELSERGKPEQFPGAFAGIVRGVNEMLDAILLPIGEGNRVLAQISDGKIDELVAQTYKGDHEKMKLAVNNVATVLQSLQKEMARLTQASHEGQLSERGKPEQFTGAYAGIVRGVNDMLDAILLPIGEGNRVLAQISDGKIDELITHTYKGDHEKMKVAINNVAEVLQTLEKMLAHLTGAARNGQLAERGQPEVVKGAYADIIRGVNALLDAIIGPLNVSARYVDLIAKGDIPPVITEQYNGDFNTIKNNLNACIEALEAVGTATNKTADTLQESMKSIAQNAQALSSSSQQLAATSQQMSGNAEETSAQANTVATATQQVTTNLNSVATGAEEMTSTVQSIASNAGEAAKVAGDAVKTATDANATDAKLGESSAEIGQVIKVITSIAQQTNLLALNATIEAARAGEAGKGFAVVANEVKELAKQTAKATEDISQKITAIQDDTKRAVEAIGSITGVINQINDISSTIATAVEEQSATTNEMSRNVQEAAKGSGEISQNIQGVATAAESTTRGAQDTLKAAQQLTEMATQLSALVGQFKLGDAQNTNSVGSKIQAKSRAAHSGR
jgi:methyl-accepting chemotaxis protein